VISSGLVYGPTPTGVNDGVRRRILTPTVTIRREDGLVESIPPEALLAAHSPQRRKVANALRRLVKRAVPTAIERVRTGWGVIGYDVPIGRRTRFFAWIWLQPEHVHLGFQNGVLMDDPNAVLQGAGVTKQVRWLTVNSLEEIREGEFMELVREAARIGTMSKSERFARLLDREDRP
jgi:hypothetical protein